MEIERKFFIENIPDTLNLSKCRKRTIEQAYLCTEPVVRVRRDDDDYYLTYKGKGMMVREEYNLPLNRESYEHLLSKADGKIISKKRYEIPDGDFTIELDMFEKDYDGLIMAEVEFSTEEEAMKYIKPAWFGEEVTNNPKYHNSNMSKS